MKSDDEKEFFRHAMSDIEPLKQDRIELDKTKPAPVARFTHEDNQRVLEASLSDPNNLVENGDEVQFCRAGVQHPVLKKLRQGKYSINQEIDLHGLTVEQAKLALNQFLKEATRHHWSCIRVIHGKGNRSFQGIAVLRPKVINWLRKNNDVLAFASAQLRDGGTGALYVLLNRSR